MKQSNETYISFSAPLSSRQPFNACLFLRMPGLWNAQTFSSFVPLVAFSKHFIEHFKPFRMKSTTSSALSYNDGDVDVEVDADCIQNAARATATRATEKDFILIHFQEWTVCLLPALLLIYVFFFILITDSILYKTSHDIRIKIFSRHSIENRTWNLMIYNNEKDRMGNKKYRIPKSFWWPWQFPSRVPCLPFQQTTRSL